MKYNQTQIAKLLHVSKSTVSRFIRDNGFTTDDNLYSESERDEIMRLFLQRKQMKKSVTKVPDDIARVLQQRIDDLKEQLSKKDEQIEELHRLLDQQQQLQLTQQQQLLEAPKKGFWSRLFSSEKG